MSKSSRKVAIAMVAIAAIAGVVASISVLSYSGQSKQVEASAEADAVQGKSIGLGYTDPDAYVADTGKSVGKAEVTSETVSVERGSSASIEVIAKHIGGENADQTINVKILPPIGYTIYPPSVAKSTTAEERGMAMAAGNPISGSIDLATFVTIQEPSEKAIAKDGQQSYEVTINIPENVPDELLGEAIFIPINIEVTDVNGKILPGESTGLHVVVS